MCMTDSSINIDIDSSDLGEEYQCINCNTKFRGIGKNLHCPSCDSMQIKRLCDE